MYQITTIRLLDRSRIQYSSLRSCPNLSHVANVERGPPLTNLTIYFTFCGTCSHPSPIARRFCSSIALGLLGFVRAWIAPIGSSPIRFKDRQDE
ncbi:hypothetical protein SDJN03_17443, partial [Cucurbita argyrosperma subsp. sororia]